MDGLDEFEKGLAAEKQQRELESQDKERRERRKHRHHHRDKSPRREGDDDKHGHKHRHRSHRHDSDDGEGHRHKRSRHAHDGEEESRSHRHRHRHRSREGDRARPEDETEKPKGLDRTDQKDKLPIPDEETPGQASLKRDSWMTAPSAIDIDYVQRASKPAAPAPVRDEPPRALHEKELNRGIEAWDKGGETSEDGLQPTQREVNYKFGDAGSNWRMMKLKNVYTAAEQSGRPLDDVALERFDTLQEFDEAREEKIEVDRRKVYGGDYVGKEKPTGELYKERLRKEQQNRRRTPSPSMEPPEQGVIMQQAVQPASIASQSDLNRLKSQLMKAKLRKAPNVAELEAEYNAAVASFVPGASASNDVILDASHSRMLAGTRGEVKAVVTKRGINRGNVEANEDMSIEDMVREERRTRGQAGGEGKRLAERIAKDGKFDDDLEYLDENAEKLAKRVHKNETSLKNAAVSEFKKINRILDSCPLCHHEDLAPPQNLPNAPIVSLGTRVYLTLPTEPELTGAEGGAVITPLSHRTNLIECDDDEWEEIRNFMKSLTRMYHDQGREVVFYENAAVPQRRMHAALVVVPIPWDQGDTVPAFFREAMLSADEEWSQHKKIIDTGKRAREGLGKLAFRRSIAKEMPYFHVWFTLDGGLGHIVEDASRWPKGDLFAREILGGMLDCEPDVIKRQGRWTRSDGRVDDFRKRWRKFDWTRVLTEG